MALQIEATYENGVLKLERNLPFKNGQKVRLTIEPPGGRVRKAYGLMGWKGDPAIIDQVALDPDFGIQESP